MLCKTKSSRPFETEPKNDFTPINPTNQSPIPKIRAIIGYFQSQKHVLLVWRRHTILTYHFTSLVISLCVLLYAWVLKTHWKKNTNLGPSHVQHNRLLCGICTNNIIKPISTLITSWLESSRRVFDRGSHCSDGLRYRRLWDQDKTLSRSMSTPRVENTCTVSNIIGPVIYMGVFGFKCCPCHSTIRLLWFAVHVVSDSNSLFTDHLVNVPHKTGNNLDLANPNLSQTENVWIHGLNCGSKQYALHWIYRQIHE